MELIKKLGRRLQDNGKGKQYWGLFLCPDYKKEVEKNIKLEITHI